MGSWSTTPKDWADSATVTASDFDTHLRDFANAFGAFTSYTPTLTASTTSPTLGSGSTAAGKYLRVQKLVIAQFQIIFGSSMAAGSGTYYVSLPVTASTTSPYRHIGEGYFYDSSTSALLRPALTLPNDGTKVRATYPATWPTGTETSVAHGTPWTWAQSDQLNGWLVYEAA